MQEFLKNAKEKMFPKMEGAAVCMTIMSGTVDAKIALELGACLLFDKPLILAVTKNTPIPARLLRLADAVVELGDDPEKSREAITDAIVKVTAKYPEGKRTPTPTPKT